MFTEFQNIFEILIESEVKMLMPMIEQKFRAINHNELKQQN